MCNRKTLRASLSETSKYNSFCRQRYLEIRLLQITKLFENLILYDVGPFVLFLQNLHRTSQNETVRKFKKSFPRNKAESVIGTAPLSENFIVEERL